MAKADPVRRNKDGKVLFISYETNPALGLVCEFVAVHWGKQTSLDLGAGWR